MSNEGFLVSGYIAMLFFRFCGRYKITDRESRVAVLREIVRRRKGQYVRDVDTYLRGKKIGFRSRGSN